MGVQQARSLEMGAWNQPVYEDIMRDMLVYYQHHAHFCGGVQFMATKKWGNEAIEEVDSGSHHFQSRWLEIHRGNDLSAVTPSRHENNAPRRVRHTPHSRLLGSEMPF